MNEFYNKNHMSDEDFETALNCVVSGSNKNFELFKKNTENLINGKTLKEDAKEVFVKLLKKVEQERAEFKKQYKMPELLIDFLAEVEEPERNLLEQWFDSCCNCMKDEFKEIEEYTNDFLNKNSYSRHSIRKIINSIKQYRAERGL